jgi:hypothetical protein
MWIGNEDGRIKGGKVVFHYRGLWIECLDREDGLSVYVLTADMDATLFGPFSSVEEAIDRFEDWNIMMEANNG